MFLHLSVCPQERVAMKTGGSAVKGGGAVKRCGAVEGDTVKGG